MHDCRINPEACCRDGGRYNKLDGWWKALSLASPARTALLF
jgi:hypothetical protein